MPIIRMEWPIPLAFTAEEAFGVDLKIAGADVVYLSSGLDENLTAIRNTTRSRFTPALLAVVVGSQVDFANDDFIDHSVFSLSLTKVIDLGLYGQERSKLVTFDKAGKVELGCLIHPSMGAVILVLQNPFFAKPSADGSFAIRGVPSDRILQGRRAPLRRRGDLGEGRDLGRAVTRKVRRESSKALVRIEDVLLGYACYFVTPPSRSGRSTRCRTSRRTCRTVPRECRSAAG